MNYFINNKNARLEIMPDEIEGTMAFSIVDLGSEMTFLVEVEFSDVEAIKEMLSNFIYAYEQALKEKGNE